MTYTHEWLRDGEPTEHVEARVPASATTKDEMSTVRVTPVAGTRVGPTASASVGGGGDDDRSEHMLVALGTTPTCDARTLSLALASADAASRPTSRSGHSMV